MKAYTKKQKLEAYTYALLCIYVYMDDQSEDQFICNNLGRWMSKDEKKSFDFELSVFPEFAQQKPTHEIPVNVGGGWWHHRNNGARIRAIERAIRLTEQLIK